MTSPSGRPVRVATASAKPDKPRSAFAQALDRVRSHEGERVAFGPRPRVVQSQGTHMFDERASLAALALHRTTEARPFAYEKHQQEGRELQKRRSQASALYRLHGVGRDQAGQVARQLDVGATIAQEIVQQGGVVADKQAGIAEEKVVGEHEHATAFAIVVIPRDRTKPALGGVGRLVSGQHGRAAGLVFKVVGFRYRGPQGPPPLGRRVGEGQGQGLRRLLSDDAHADPRRQFAPAAGHDKRMPTRQDPRHDRLPVVLAELCVWEQHQLFGLGIGDLRDGKQSLVDLESALAEIVDDAGAARG